MTDERLIFKGTVAWDDSLTIPSMYEDDWEFSFLWLRLQIRRFSSLYTFAETPKTHIFVNWCALIFLKRFRRWILVEDFISLGWGWPESGRVRDPGTGRLPPAGLWAGRLVPRLGALVPHPFHQWYRPATTGPPRPPLKEDFHHQDRDQPACSR